MDAEQVTASIVIAAFNAQATLDRCLQALACQNVPANCFEIIVVDDGSSDDTPGVARGHAGVRVLCQAHAGPAAARNLGVERARGRVVLFTDADCEPAPDWVERMLAPFGAAADPCLPGDGVAGVKGAYLTRQRELVARFVQLEYEDKYDRMAREAAIDFVDTYSAGYRRDVLLANGGFDTGFPVASVEDQELSFRLARRGYKMVFIPAARVYHWGHPRTVAEYVRKKLRIGYWKVRVHRRHPAKVWHDSHTPPVLKVQVLLAGLGGLAACGAIPFPPLWWAVGGAALLFALTTVPFTVKAWRKDGRVGAVAPGLLFVRALALGAGFALGLVASLRSSGS